jgi:hypothetical protein
MKTGLDRAMQLEGDEWRTQLHRHLCPDIGQNTEICHLPPIISATITFSIFMPLLLAMNSKTLPLCRGRIVAQNGTVKSAQISMGISSGPVRVWFDASIPILPPRLFHNATRLSSVSFESNSRLTRIKSEAF